MKRTPAKMILILILAAILYRVTHPHPKHDHAPHQPRRINGGPALGFTIDPYTLAPPFRNRSKYKGPAPEFRPDQSFLTYEDGAR